MKGRGAICLGRIWSLIFRLCMLLLATLTPVMFGQDAVRGRVANPHGALDVACENCHTTTAWKPIRRQPEFNHNTQTKFALLGLHQNVACTGCHVNLVFSKAPTQCSECHADLHRRQFGSNCQECHSVRGWNVEISALKDHSNRFPLIGAHAAATCDDCHHGAATGVYTGLSTQCVSCHLRDYQTATPLNHVAANLPTTCESCHSMNVWQGARFNHLQVTGFALTGAHATLACAQCHVGNRFTGTPIACYGCHVNDFTHTTDPNHIAAAFPQDCSLCHTTLTWSGAAFDHTKLTAFPLTGQHTTVTCAQCHVGNKFVGTPTACSGCHLQDYANTTNPNHRAANFSTTCETCHNTAGWQNATFDHSVTRFALTGAHQTVGCNQCHVNGNFNNTPLQCAGCHLADFQKTTAPNHVAAGFPQDCSTCHTTVQWTGATFNHTSTGFALTGSHTSVQCAQCHVNNNFSLTSTACITCHLNDYNTANSPNHKSAGFPQDCTLCHNTVQWNGATFDHSTTGFTLTGAHTTAQCAQCHVSNNFSLSSTACVTCHLNDYNTANNPNHKAANFPQDCTACHTTVQWLGAQFNHTSTGFALTGAHTSLQCSQCHVNGNYNFTNGACINCHLNDFNTANAPSHVKAGFPQDCTLCHTTVQWMGAKFDHTTTGFTLTGTHTSLQCAQCHANNNFSLPNGNCWNCHQNDYNGTTNPPHKVANFPQDCSGCHTTVNWLGATFNHATTGFALVGTHATQQCTACHVNNNYTLASGACWNCHQTDYKGATNPPHAASGFPQDCTLCHGTAITNWLSATFNHTSTGFALVGMHATLQCAQCHTNGNYNLPNGACWNCHQTDYSGANSPPHAASGFPQDCTVCHGTAATNWTSATFNHSNTGFALTGTHTSLQCAQCHVNNNYSLPNGNCWNCHQTDYNGTTNPPHKASNFPQDCSGCHTTVNWLGATFNHSSTGFTLVGVHATQQCTACHVNNNYTLSSTACITCHLADFNGTNNPPHQASGFPQDCTICHGTSITNWTSATFNHSTTGFALTGAHTSLQCAQCHVNNNYSLPNGACWNCHQTDYNGTTNPPHKASNFPQDCSGCHTTTNWLGATFNHSSTGFTLVGVHATQQCTACHVNNNYTLSSTACITCHQTDYNGANNPPHASAGFPTDCTVCHGTTITNWTSATFNHSTTGFTLTGAHTSLQCAQCHVNNNYSLPNGNCWNCHQADYNGTNNPPHAAQGFPQDCSGCHTTTNWLGATFNHSTTGFALTGFHTSLQCSQCHVNNNYTLNSPACWNCHQADYNGTNNPSHSAASFPQDCSLCHSTTNWSGATFTHPTTPLQLTGYHATMLTNNQCSLCHVGNNYTSTPSDCWSCHQTDYNNTTNPNHAAAGFAQTCNSCHTFTDWTGAQYKAHDSAYFPIYSGTHQGKWTQCSDCHTNSANYAVFTCIACHQHSNQTQVTQQHSGVKNFVYNATSCYTCHPKGSGG
ncbi:MAG TPA: hypothetical protein VKT49_12350 [Bryobacteraceae bacterium]|nr:hypothetical protein [Bryobacteraceae bacterium]